MSRRLSVLAVSPHFPPVNAPDHQRLRTCLPYMKDLGIDIHVLAISPESVEGQPLDQFLLEQLPRGVPVTRVHAIAARATRWLGIGNVALRGLGALHQAASRLIRSRHFDLAFFTSTQFACYPLGPLWKRLYDLPYILDFQDPWVNDYYLRPGAPPPPGGWKFHVIRRINTLLQEPTVRGAAGIIRTSAGYRFRGRRCPVATIPFGASEADFSAVRNRLPPRAGGPHVRWVSVGRGGADMARGLKTFFTGLAEARRRDPAAFASLKVYFIGTSYAPRGTGSPSVHPLAVEAGVGDMVIESTDRVGYREAIEQMLSADGLILPCSDDSRYNPSKLAGLAMAGRPVLALGPEDGELAVKVTALGTGRVLDRDASVEQGAIACRWLLGAEAPQPDEALLYPMTAEFMARRMARFFRRVAAEQRP
ncbi:hypothetical protein GC173_03675 [bacterium]|nr:hypothetical protein [bacterium]